MPDDTDAGEETITEEPTPVVVPSGPTQVSTAEPEAAAPSESVDEEEEAGFFASLFTVKKPSISPGLETRSGGLVKRQRDRSQTGGPTADEDETQLAGALSAPPASEGEAADDATEPLEETETVADANATVEEAEDTLAALPDATVGDEAVVNQDAPPVVGDTAPLAHASHESTAGVPVVPVSAILDAGLMAYRARDYRTAIANWLPLAEDGNLYAQFFVGGLYADGSGVPRDPVRALVWWTLAANQGHENAGQFTENLKLVMEPDQVVAAGLLAKSWEDEN